MSVTIATPGCMVSSNINISKKTDYFPMRGSGYLQIS
jgi:hypothetical protein